MRRNDPIFQATVLSPAGDELYVVTTGFGSDMTYQFSGARVMSISFEDDEKKADKLELTVSNLDLAHFDNPVWKHGNIIRFRFGYVDAMGPEREAIIQKTTGFLTLKVSALAKSVLLNTTTRSRVWDGRSRSQVVEEIARSYGYVDDQLHVDDTGEVYETITQARLTDAQFIRRLAHREGFLFYVDNTGFHFHPRRVEQAPSREFIWRIDQGAGDIISIDTDQDVFAKPKRHRTRGRNPNARTDVEGDAGDASHADRHATAPVLGLIDVPDLETLAVRTEQRVERGRAESNGVSDVAPTSETTSAGATRRARARYRAAQQGAVKLKVEIIGDPNMSAKRVITMSAISQRLSGRYYVRSCKSTVDASGFKQSLQLSSDGHSGYGGRRGAGAGTGADVPTQARVNEQQVAAGVQEEPFDAVDRETQAVTSITRRARYVPPPGSTGEHE